MTRRSRYYAYAAKAGGVIWMTRTMHDFVQSRPHTIGHHQCTHYLGQTQLMTMDEWRQTRGLRSKGAAAGNGAQGPQSLQA